MIGGRAGDGSLITGQALAKLFRRMGLEVYTYRDFPSNIRGLPTSYTIRAKDKPIACRKDFVDILLALDPSAVEIHLEELVEGGAILYDNSLSDVTKESLNRGVYVYKAPMKDMAISKLGGSAGEIFKNVIAIGILSKLLALPDDLVQQTLTEMFVRKGEPVVKKNLQAYEMGVSYAGTQITKADEYLLRSGKANERMMVTGDEAVAYGAIVAGCRFFSGYPITPTTEILEWLAEYMPRYNGVVVQSEDELAAITMAVGAGYAGVRAMTATSGPGQALMTEGIGLAGMTETPVVIVHGQRGGPSTGLPTKTEQSDLKHIIFASHGEFPRIVLAPGTVEDSFYLTVDAFNLAEKFQCPVFLLMDQALCQNKHTIESFDLKRVKVDRGKLVDEQWIKKMGQFRRYELAHDGISPRSVPSQEGGIYVANGNEHDEMGETTEDRKLRIAMMMKRLRKMDLAAKEVPPPRHYGSDGAEVGLIGYGSAHGPIMEAMERLNGELSSKYLQLVTLWPFPTDEVAKFIESARKVFVVENNATGQLAMLVRMMVGNGGKVDGILKFDGSAFRPCEIAERIGEEM